MDSLVDSEWLAAHLHEPDLVVLDCSVQFEPLADGTVRQASGRGAYDAGHIPGAGFADLTTDLCDRTSELSFALPTAAEFCAAMGRLGVSDSSRVVLYDSSISAWASRVWWMLRWVGFDRAAILDGGLRVWTAEGRELSTEPVVRTPGVLTPHVRPELIADCDEMHAAIGNAGVVLIDTLPPGQFTGERPMYSRPGHLPGAINVPALGQLDDDGRYLPLTELAAQHPIEPGVRAITYCGGGIAASSNAFTLTRLGHRDVAVYAASLQEWTANSANPLVTGT